MGDFTTNCTKYFNDKNEIFILKNLFLKKLAIINSRLSKLPTDNSSDTFQLKYLQHKKAAIITEFNILQLIINSQIKYDCQNLTTIRLQNEQTGQGRLEKTNKNILNVNEYKISKYLHKISDLGEDKSNTKKKTYINMLNKYIINGGSVVLDDTILINNVLTNQYNLITDFELYKNSKQQLKLDENTLYNNFDGEDVNAEMPKSSFFNTNYLYIKTDTQYGPNYAESKYNYKFRRNLKSTATDIFMDNVLAKKQDGLNYNDICNYTYFELSSYFYEYIYKYNLNSTDKKLGDNDIILLYKGGNTTRMYLNLLMSNLNKLNKPTSQFPLLNKLITDTSVGDWDFNVSINFNNLITKGFTKLELTNIVKQCKQISAIALNKIKLTFNKLLDGDLSSNYAMKMSSEFHNNISSNITEYEQDIKSLPRVARESNEGSESSEGSKNIKIKIKKLQLYNHLINYKLDDQNNYSTTIVNNFDNKKIFKDSYIITDNPHDTTLSTPTQFVTKNVDSVVTFFTNNELTEFIPDNILRYNNLHIVYSDMLFFIRHKTMINFSLFRLKFNNIMTIIKHRVDQANNLLEEKPIEEIIKIPIEIVDLSVSSIDDNRQDYDEIFFKKYTIIPSRTESPQTTESPQPTTNHYQKINFTIEDKLSENTITPYNIETVLPSADYMFYDISGMLFADNMFIWEDKKYFKRIGRLMNLAIICELSRGTTVTKLIGDYNNFSEFVTTYNKSTYDNTNIIDKIYNEIITGTLIKVTNNTPMINNTITTIPQTKLLELNRTDGTYQINFFIDKFIANYYETIILLKYFTDSNMNYTSENTGIDTTLKDTLKAYCEYQNTLLTNIQNKKNIKHNMVDTKTYLGMVDYESIEHYKKQEIISTNINKLLEYHTKLLEYIEKSKQLLEEIKASEITNFDKFDFSTNQLY
jgi:hypothetical protein